jgi:hypothetical protein
MPRTYRVPGEGRALGHRLKNGCAGQRPSTRSLVVEA